MPLYRVVDFDPYLALWLAPKIRPGDRAECHLRDQTPLQAISMGSVMGGCYIVLRGDIPIGIFGWTTMGTIWSLWADLTVKDSIEVLKQTPMWVRQCQRESGHQVLENTAFRYNHQTIAWLEAAGCFELDYSEEDPVWLSFKTKPIQMIPAESF